jgi:hypothetical protein
MSATQIGSGGWREDTKRFDGASLIRLKSGEAVPLHGCKSRARKSPRSFVRRRCRAFYRIKVKFKVACCNEEHFHAKAVFRGAARFIESHPPECSFRRERFERSYLLLNEALDGRGVDIPKRCPEGHGCLGESRGDVWERCLRLRAMERRGSVQKRKRRQRRGTVAW